MTPLSQRLGDLKSHSVLLTWGSRPFSPGAEWTLLWTLKSNPLTQADADADCQKRSGAGITVSGSTAQITLTHYDTAGGTFPPEGEVDPVTLSPLTPGTYHWDIQAQSLSDAANVRTVANGTLLLRQTTTQ